MLTVATTAERQQPQQPRSTAKQKRTQQQPANNNNNSNKHQPAAATAGSMRLKLPDFTHQQECGLVGMNDMHPRSSAKQVHGLPPLVDARPEGLDRGPAERASAAKQATRQQPHTPSNATHRHTHTHKLHPAHCGCLTYTAVATAAAMLLLQ